MLAHRKPKPGAPAPMHMTSIYLDDELIEAVDQWRVRQEGRLSRSDAIRRLAWRAIKAAREEGGSR